MKNGLRYGNPAGFLQRLSHQSVRFLSALRRRKIVAALEVNRIDLFNRHELTKINSVVGFGFQALEFVFSDLHVIALGKLKAANQIGTFNNGLAYRANDLIAHVRATFLVQQMRADRLILNGGMNIDGNGDEAEEKNTAIDNSSH